MARFHDLVGRLQNPGEDGEPDPTIFDDLTAEYDTLFEGSQNKTQELSEKIAQVNGEVSRLKSANYDLLTQVGGQDATDPIGESEEDNTVTIDSLFRPR
jgi:hypothetical protein